MTALFVGFTFIFIGAWGVAHWFDAVIVVMKGFGSLSLIVGGMVAVVAGMSSFRSTRPNGPKE